MPIFISTLDALNYRNCFPENGWFTCLIDKGTEKCMPIERACNSFNDCEDHSDEGGMCSKYFECLPIRKIFQRKPRFKKIYNFRFDGNQLQLY